MPSNDQLFILSGSELSVETNMKAQECNGVHQTTSSQEILNEQAKKWQLTLNSEEFARKLDENDELRHMRDEFHYPKKETLPKGISIFDHSSSSKFLFFYLVDKSRVDPNSECIYLCGHSLGLQPIRVRKSIDVWLRDWAHL